MVNLIIKFNLLFAFMFILINAKSNPDYILTQQAYRGYPEFLRLIFEFKSASYKINYITLKKYQEIKSFWLIFIT